MPGKLKVLGICVLLLSSSSCGQRQDQEDPDAAVPDSVIRPQQQIGKCCGANWECVTGHCAQIPLMGGIDMCSMPCKVNADCPTLAACQRIGNGGGGFITVCLPCQIVANTNDRVCSNEAGTYKCW